MTTPAPPSSDALDLFCPHCHYNLRGTDSPRCPECGKPIDRAALTAVTIPWAHRREIGRFKAFWQTTCLATFRTRALAANANAPVRFDDALAYRRTVVVHLLVLTAAALTTTWLGVGNPAPIDYFAYPAILVYYIPPPWSLLVLFAAAWLFVLMATGMPTLFFAPRTLDPQRQRRAVALAYYASGPLFVGLLSGPLLFVGSYFVDMYSGYGQPAWVTELGHALDWVLWGTAVLPFLRAWWVPVRLLPAVTNCRSRRTWACALTLPLLWLLAALLTLVLLPAVAFYATVIYYSFQ